MSKRVAPSTSRTPPTASTPPTEHVENINPTILQEIVVQNAEFAFPPSPSAYHYISPTRRTEIEAISAHKPAVKVLKPDWLIEKLQEMEGKLEELSAWKAEVRAREILARYHKSTGKDTLKKMLRDLVTEYKTIEKECNKEKINIAPLKSFFNPSDFMMEVRRVLTVKAYLKEPDVEGGVLTHEGAPPPFCVNYSDIVGKVAAKQIVAINKVLDKNHIPRDYKVAVTKYYLGVNNEVHHRATTELEMEGIKKLGNDFLAMIIEKI